MTTENLTKIIELVNADAPHLSDMIKQLVDNYEDLKCCGNCENYFITDYIIPEKCRCKNNKKIRDPNKCCTFLTSDNLKQSERMI